MPTLYNLTCPSCNSRLEIPAELETFVCETCGVEYQLKRGGGIVYAIPSIKLPETIKLNVSYWWITTNPSRWIWDTIFTNPSGEQFFRQRRREEYFETAKPGDFVFGYSASPNKQLLALAYVKKGFHMDNLGRSGILIAKAMDYLLPRPVSWSSIVSAIHKSEPVRGNAQSTLFALTSSEAKVLAGLIKDRGNPVQLCSNLKLVQDDLWG